jgi:RNA polymerase sigma-70 factor (ECF subfamily)
MDKNVLDGNTNYVSYLIELSQQGRKNAFFDLCEINLKNVFTVAYRLLSNEELAQKITLKTLFIAWENIKSFDVKKSFLFWLKGLAIKSSIMELEKHADSTKTISSNTIFAHEHEKIEKLIMDLPNEERIIFVLHDLEGYTYDEVKDFLFDSSADELKTKLIEIREKLMTQMAL